MWREHGELLRQAVLADDTVRVGGLLEQGVDINFPDADGVTPLMLAAKQGSVPMVNLLIDEGAKVGAKDKDGNSALMIAARHGNAEAVMLLLHSGAAADEANRFGDTAVSLAAVNGNADVLRFLQEEGHLPDVPQQVEVQHGRVSTGGADRLGRAGEGDAGYTGLEEDTAVIEMQQLKLEAPPDGDTGEDMEIDHTATLEGIDPYKSEGES